MKTVYLVSTIALIALATSCSRNEPREVSAGSVPGTSVHLETARSEDWPMLSEDTGTVRARSAATISSRIPAYVERVAVQQGDRVAAGQTLIVLDARDLDANVRKAAAGYSEVSSSKSEVESAVAAAKANLDLAEATFKRIEDLAAKKSVSTQEYDESLARVKAARAAYDMASSRRVQLQSRLEQAEQERRAATVMRDYSRISAPFAGVVTVRSVEPGNLAAPGSPLLTIESAAGYRLEASVAESKIASVKTGARVPIAIEAAACQGYGRVSEIVPAVDAASRSYTVKIDLPPTDATGKSQPCPEVRSGMFGRASFASGTRNVISIPAAAVVERGQLQSVFVAENGVARMRLVTTGLRRDRSVEVLSGLTAGERVITPVPSSLVDGAKLEAGQ